MDVMIYGILAPTAQTRILQSWIDPLHVCYTTLRWFGSSTALPPQTVRSNLGQFDARLGKVERGTYLVGT